MQWLAQRLAESSSHAGIGLIALAIHDFTSPHGLWAALIALVTGTSAIIKTEGRP